MERRARLACYQGVVTERRALPPTVRGDSARRAALRGAGIQEAAMKTYQGTITPNRRDLTDPRSSGKPAQAPRTPMLNDRRSTR
jgi:hypothetical protein